MYYTYMKNIMVRDEVYDALAKVKQEGESIGDVILRLYNETKARRAAEILKSARYVTEKITASDRELFRNIKRNRFKARNYDI